jgi:hypothetical protein
VDQTPESTGAQAILATERVETLALTTADRCDSCGAQAYVRVVLEAGELLFCAHHANEVKEKLEAIAVSWQDESERLLAR